MRSQDPLTGQVVSTTLLSDSVLSAEGFYSPSLFFTSLLPQFKTAQPRPLLRAPRLLSTANGMSSRWLNLNRLQTVCVISPKTWFMTGALWRMSHTAIYPARYLIGKLQILPNPSFSLLISSTLSRLLLISTPKHVQTPRSPPPCLAITSFYSELCLTSRHIFLIQFVLSVCFPHRSKDTSKAVNQILWLRYLKPPLFCLNKSQLPSPARPHLT